MRLLSRPRFVQVPVLVFAIAHALHATPTGASSASDAMAREFNRLPRQYLEKKDPALERKLVQGIVQNGIGYWTPSTLRFVAGRFDQLAGVFVASQSPGNRVDFGVQKFFRDHARPDQKKAMADALTGWFPAPIREAPPGYGPWLTPEEAQAGVLTIKLRAAEALADLNDPTTLPALVGFSSALARLHPRPLEPWQRPAVWYAERSVARLRDPNGILTSLGRFGRFRVLRGWAGVDSVAVHLGYDPRRARSIYRAVGADTARKVWDGLRQSRWAKEIRHRAAPGAVAVFLNDGSEMHLSVWFRKDKLWPGREITYAENTRIDDGWGLTIDNSELTRLVSALAVGP